MNICFCCRPKHINITKKIMSTCLSLSLFPPVCETVSLSTCLSFYLSVYLSVSTHLSARAAVDGSRALEEANSWRVICWRRLQFLHHHTGSDLKNAAVRHDGHARPRWDRTTTCLSVWWAVCVPVCLSEILERLKVPPPLCRPLVSVDEAPAECLSLMNECWNEDPSKRPSFDDIFKQVRRAARRPLLAPVKESLSL